MKYFWISLFLITFFYSCRDEPHFMGDEYTKETKDLRSKFTNQIVGTWVSIQDSVYTYIEEQYNFEDNNILAGRYILRSRDSVMINGAKVITDWRTIIDQDLSGHWFLLFNSSTNKNTISFDARNKFGRSAYIELFNVTDSFLDIQSPFTGHRIHMHRKK